MAEMSPVELLRAAAALVRQRAEGATSGPWAAVLPADHETDKDPMCAEGVYAGEGMYVFEDDETMWPDAAWIALMHPGLAEPLAVLFDTDAARLSRLIPAWSAPPSEDAEPGLAWNNPAVLAALVEGHCGRSLAIARVLLGVPDGR